MVGLVWLARGQIGLRGGDRFIRQIHRPVFAALPLPDDKLLSIERFASADTIVPNPDNPQSFNRYSLRFKSLR